MSAKDAAALVKQKTDADAAARREAEEREAAAILSHWESLELYADRRFALVEAEIMEAARKGATRAFIDVDGVLRQRPENTKWQRLYDARNTALIERLREAGYSSPDDFKIHYSHDVWHDPDAGSCDMSRRYIEVHW